MLTNFENFVQKYQSACVLNGNTVNQWTNVCDKPVHKSVSTYMNILRNLLCIMLMSWPKDPATVQRYCLMAQIWKGNIKNQGYGREMGLTGHEAAAEGVDTPGVGRSYSGHLERYIKTYTSGRGSIRQIWEEEIQ